MVNIVILVFVGGALGAMLREFTMLMVPNLADNFPLDILVANLVAAFLLGLVKALHHRQVVSDDAEMLVGTGIGGGLSEMRWDRLDGCLPRNSSGMRRSSPLGLLYRPHETHEQADAATAPCASVVVVSAQNRPLQLLLDPVPAVAAFSARSKEMATTTAALS